MVTLTPIFASVIRHGLTTIGGGVGFMGVATDADIQSVAGAISVLVGFGWSLFNVVKKK